jgi:hypothetical protein
VTSLPTTVPAWQSLSLKGLFQKGPWELVLLLWVLAGILPGLWVSILWLRASPSVDWKIAACLGWGLGSVLAIPSVRKYFGREGGPRPTLLVAAVSAASAVIVTLVFLTVFRPEMKQASPCAPTIVAGESIWSVRVSYVLPWVLWFLWCRYTLAAFPPIDAKIWEVTHSRFEAYTKALGRLGGRLVTAMVFVMTILGLAYHQFRSLPSTATAELAISTLRLPHAVLIPSDERAELVSLVQRERHRRELAAQTDLANLDFEGARPLIETAACDFLMPGESLNPDILRAHSAFVVLDQLSQRPGDRKLQSSDIVESVLALVPLNGSQETSTPVCPLFFKSAQSNAPVADIDSLSQLSMTHKVVTYHGIQLMDVWLASRPLTASEAVTLEVAIRIYGSVGTDTALVSLVAKRLGKAPAQGPLTIGAGALCASWNLDSIGLRLGPAVRADIGLTDVKPTSPLWLTCFDPIYSRVLWPLYRRTDGLQSFDPHGCGYLPPAE